MDAAHKHGKTIEKSKSELERESDNLRDELQVALLAAEDIRALRVKSTLLIDRLRDEKEARVALKVKHDILNKKVEMMADHLEKLMNHLRIEAKQKSRIIDSRRKTNKQLSDMRQLCEKQQKLIESKNRYLAEVCEGSKLLEDQLRLMDDKYLDMRRKLDYAREVNRTEVVKAQKEASGLRRKFATLTGSTRLLDTVQDARELYGQSANTMDDQRAVSWADFPHTPGSPGNDSPSTPSKRLTQNRAQSAPSRRPSSGVKHSHNEPMKAFEAPPPTLDHVLNKIEKKRRDKENNWDVDRAKELLAETEEHYRPKSGKPPKPKVEFAPVQREHSAPNILSQVKFRASMHNESPETSGSVVFEEPHSRNTRTTFAILGRGQTR